MNKLPELKSKDAHVLLILSNTPDEKLENYLDYRVCLQPSMRIDKLVEVCKVRDIIQSIPTIKEDGYFNADEYYRNLEIIKQVLEKRYSTRIFYLDFRKVG